MVSSHMAWPLAFVFLFSTLCTSQESHNRAPRNSSVISVQGSTPSGAGVPLEAFVSFSIEFAFFPDYAGNTSHPNTFSNNLLNNIGSYAGTKPYIRVGGNTQDYAIFNSSLQQATVGIYDPAKSTDYPTTLTFGPAFFQSYHTWPDTKFSHGFNLGRNSTAAHKALIESVPYACKALNGGELAFWELGNEPDLYSTSSQGPVRPPNWTESTYVAEWLHWSQQIRKAMEKPCPNLAAKDKYLYIAPSFAGTDNTLNPITTWKDGLDRDKDIALISSHNYISGATTPGVTLQGTLMNHTSTVASVANQLNESHLLANLPQRLNPGLPFILGETNSLYNEGRPGLSNTFGAALWGVDFNLYCAANNIHRVHMHQGTNYRYQAWQPISTNDTSIGTKAPYYGSIAVAAFLGDIVSSPPSVVNIPLSDSEESAYAAYVGGKLERVIVVNMMGYNATAGNPYIDNYTRPMEKYEFQLPKAYQGTADVQWLMANGSDAITGVTFDGYSYNYDLEEGRPAVLHNVTRGQTVAIGGDGMMRLSVPRSSAAIVSFGK